MLHNKYTAILVMLLFFIPALPLTAPEPARKPTDIMLYQRTEWTGRSNYSSEFLFCDTDGDGGNEMIFWGDDGNSTDWRGFVQVYDLPGYGLLWAANYSGSAHVEVVDIWRDGSLQLIISQYADRGDPNVTIVSGRDLSTIWKSPDFEGSIFSRVVDLNRDRKNELVIFNQSGPLYGRPPPGDSRIWVYETSGFERLWMSPNLDDAQGYDLVDLDADAALEIIVNAHQYHHLYTSNNSLLVFDGATFKLEWQTPENESVTIMHLLGYMDVDNDAQIEVVTRQYTGHGYSLPSNLVVYGGATGALEWASSFAGSLDSVQLADINGDGIQELLATLETSTSSSNDFQNLTHCIFEMKNHEMLWKTDAGIFDRYKGEGSSLQAMDINGDGCQELMIQKVLRHSYGSYISWMTVVDGRTFEVLWDSPGFEGFIKYEKSAQMDSDPSWEMLISWRFPQNGDWMYRLSIYATDIFNEEWSAGPFLADVWVDYRNVLGDCSAEILLDIFWNDMLNHDCPRELRVLDGQTRDLLWSRPLHLWSDPGIYEREIHFEDIVGSPSNEIIIIWLTADGGHLRQEYITVYNDTTFLEEWRSDIFDGALYVNGQGDFDGDGNMEMTVANYIDDPIYMIWEFVYAPVRLPDPAVAEKDILFSNNTPVSGMEIAVSVTVRNIGNVDVANVTAEFIVDQEIVDTRLADIASGGSLDWSVNLKLDQGRHMIAVRLRMEWFAEELDRGNNCAERPISVRPRPPPSPVISSPAEGAAFGEGESIFLNGSASSAFLGRELNYSWVDGDETLGNSSMLNVTMPIGLHHLTLTVDDGSGSTEAGVNITIVPSVKTKAVISSPVEGAVFGSDESFLFDGGNTTPDRQDYGLMFLWTSNISGPISVEPRSCLRLPPGTHMICLSVYDRYGGFSSASVNITVFDADKHPPSLTILVPANGAIVKGAVKIRGTAQRLSCEMAVYVRIDDGPWHKATGLENWSLAWDASTSENGLHRITAKIDYDLAGSPEVAIIVHVKNILVLEPPSKPPQDNGILRTAFAAGALLVLLLSAATLFTHRLRKGRRTRP